MCFWLRLQQSALQPTDVGYWALRPPRGSDECFRVLEIHCSAAREGIPSKATSLFELCFQAHHLSPDPYLLTCLSYQPMWFLVRTVLSDPSRQYLLCSLTVCHSDATTVCSFNICTHTLLQRFRMLGAKQHPHVLADDSNAKKPLNAIFYREKNRALSPMD